jgi:hypothetical protein
MSLKCAFIVGSVPVGLRVSAMSSFKMNVILNPDIKTRKFLKTLSQFNPSITNSASHKSVPVAVISGSLSQ